MTYRLTLLVVIAASMFACGDEKEGPKQEALEVKPATVPPVTEEGKALLQNLDEATRQQAAAVDKKEESREAPVSEKMFVLNEAFKASGFRIETLRLPLPEDKKAGIPYVKIRYYGVSDGKNVVPVPERAEIYDANGINTEAITYMWTWPTDKKQPLPIVDGAVLLAVAKGDDGPVETMSGAYPIYKYCPVEGGNFFVHSARPFLVHATWSRKVELTPEAVTVSLWRGTDQNGDVPVWPGSCAEMDYVHTSTVPANLNGIHKEVYGYDADGRLAKIEFFDKENKPTNNLLGVHKFEYVFKDGLKQQERISSKDGLMVKYSYVYNKNGLVENKQSLDMDDKLKADYFGFVKYEFTHDEFRRVIREVRFKGEQEVAEKHLYTYDKKKGHLLKEEILDANDNPVTTYVHEYNDKGSRVKYSIFEGKAEDKRYKTDYNRVAEYRFSYNARGELIEQSRHGIVPIKNAQGQDDLALTTGLDGFARVVYTFEEKTNKLIETRIIKADTNGNPAFEDIINEKGVMTQIVRDYEGTTLKGYSKSIADAEHDGIKEHYDAADKLVLVSKVTFTPDRRPAEIAWFGSDGKTPAVSPKGCAKDKSTFNEMGLLAKIECVDASGVTISGFELVYENGKFKEKKPLGPAAATTPQPVPNP